MTDNTEMHDKTAPSEDGLSQSSFQGASVCPSCTNLGEFDLPEESGHFDIACYDCGHIYEIDAAQTITLASFRSDEPYSDEMLLDDDSADTQVPSEVSENYSVQCLTCGNAIIFDDLTNFDEEIAPHCPHCADHTTLTDDDSNLSDNDPIDENAPTRFNHSSAHWAQASRSGKSGKTGIILVSILSAGLVVTAAMIALGLYFLTLRADSDVTRYIEANILQLTPAQFDVSQATYEISETELGRSLLVSITISNSGQVEGTPEEMKVVLVDANETPLITWPLDTTGQLIAPGQTTQLYTRLFEPPENFTNLQVFVR